jgi:hypothetical protein
MRHQIPLDVINIAHMRKFCGTDAMPVGHSSQHSLPSLLMHRKPTWLIDVSTAGRGAPPDGSDGSNSVRTDASRP